MVPHDRYARLRFRRVGLYRGQPYSGLWIGTKGKASDNLELYPDLYGQYMFIIDSKRMLKVSKDKRSQGMSLRCVKE